MEAARGEAWTRGRAPAGCLQGRRAVVLVTRQAKHLGVCACCFLAEHSMEAVNIGLGNGLSKVRAGILGLRP